MAVREFRFMSKDGKRHTPWRPVDLRTDEETAPLLPSRETSTWLGEKFNLEIRGSDEQSEEKI